MLTKERRKQKDFFEKEKLKSKMKLLGVSPIKSSAVSLDLLNLYVVNQISTKRDYSENIRKPIHVDINRGINFPLRRHNVELPESPPHRLSKPFLDDIQHRIQQEVLENRRIYLSEKQNIQSQFLQSSQQAKMKCEEPWLSNAAYRQRNFSNPDVDTPAGLYFRKLNSPEYNNPFGKSPKISDEDTDFGNRPSEEPLFGFVNNTLKATKDESSQPTAALFGEENQQFPFVSSSESYHSFANNNIINQLFIDLGDANKISNMHSPYDMEEMHQMSSCAQRYPAERDLKGIFTAPEQICFPSSQSLNASNQECINQLKDYCIQERNPIIISEHQENTKDFENTGEVEKLKRNIKVADTRQNCLKKGRIGGLAVPNLNNLQILGLEETEKETCQYYDQHSKCGRQKDEESQLSSQSPNYSPKEIDRHASTTSDQSEEEEQDGRASCCFENCFPRRDGNLLSVSGNQRSQGNCKSMAMYSIFFEKETTDIHPCVKPATDLKKSRTHESFGNKYTNFKTQLDAWSQTEICAKEIDKSDAAVQCDIMQACSCNNELSFVHSAEIVTSTSKVETTGGQNILADTAALQPLNSRSSLFTKSLSPETEYLTVYGKINLGIPDIAVK